MSQFKPRALKFLSLSLLFFHLSACQVYESQGKKDFENKAAELSLSSTAIADSELADTTTTCWSQPSEDSLWQLPAHNESLRIRQLNTQEIEVCLQLIQNPGAPE